MKKGTARPKKKLAASAPRVGRDDILPEYDFSRARRNPYARRYAASTNIVELDADVAAVFPNAEAVNRALRSLAGIIREHGPTQQRRARKARNTGPSAPR